MDIVDIRSSSGCTGAQNLIGSSSETYLSSTITNLACIEFWIHIYLHHLADLAAVAVFSPHCERSGN